MINPKDLFFRTNITTIKDILYALKENRFNYDKNIYNGNIDSQILEALLLNFPLSQIIVRYDHSLDIPIDDSYIAIGYKVFQGHGLLRTLKYFVLDDMPIHDFTILTELNNKRFSEFPLSYQRRIKERTITFYVEDTYPMTDNELVVQKYIRILKSME